MGCLSFALNWAFCYSKPSENPFISVEEMDYLKGKISKYNIAKYRFIFDVLVLL